MGEGSNVIGQGLFAVDEQKGHQNNGEGYDRVGGSAVHKKRRVRDAQQQIYVR
jgi:hypothetical protein